VQRLLKTLRKEDPGEIMVESTIVVVITIIVLLAILSLGFLYYQQSMLTTAANDVAAKIGAGYKYASQDLDDFTITQEALENVPMYRTSFSLLSMKSLNKSRTEDYLPDRVKLTSFGINDSAVTIDGFDINVDNVGRLHVDVQVSMKSEFLFSDVLEYLGIIESAPTFTAHGRAECLDITAYASHVEFLEYVKSKNGGSIGSILDSIVNVVNSAKSIAETFR
jgi:Flp pilus assembly protein TadG